MLGRRVGFPAEKYAERITRIRLSEKTHAIAHGKLDSNILLTRGAARFVPR
jgi:hypothetical protein